MESPYFVGVIFALKYYLFVGVNGVLCCGCCRWCAVGCEYLY